MTCSDGTLQYPIKIFFLKRGKKKKEKEMREKISLLRSAEEKPAEPSKGLIRSTLAASVAAQLGSEPPTETPVLDRAESLLGGCWICGGSSRQLARRSLATRGAGAVGARGVRRSSQRNSSRHERARRGYSIGLTCGGGRRRAGSGIKVRAG